MPASPATNRRAVRSVGASESWDHDFEFQHSVEDLALSPSPKHLSASPTLRHKRGSVSSGLPSNTPYSNDWPSASALSFHSEDPSEPTITPRRLKYNSTSSSFGDATETLTLHRPSGPSGRLQQQRNPSRSSATSTSSSFFNESLTRSGTPSLTDHCGLSTATETELDTEGWDDLRYSSAEETGADTEVDDSRRRSKPPTSEVRVASTSSASERRRSGFRMPSLNSLFRSKSKRRSSTSLHNNKYNDIEANPDLPSDLRGLATSPSLQLSRPDLLKIQSAPTRHETIKIVPLRAHSSPRHRAARSDDTRRGSSDNDHLPRSSVTTSSVSRPASQQTIRRPAEFASDQDQNTDVRPRTLSVIQQGITLNPNPSRVSFASTTTCRDSDVDDEDGQVHPSPRKGKRRKLKKRHRATSDASANTDIFHAAGTSILTTQPSFTYQSLSDSTSFQSEATPKPASRTSTSAPSSAVPPFPFPAEHTATVDPIPDFSPTKAFAGSTPPATQKSRKRPMSLSVMLSPRPGLRPAMTSPPQSARSFGTDSAQPSAAPASATPWRRFHRPSSSVSSVPTTTADSALRSSTSSIAVRPPSFLARARAVSKSSKPDTNGQNTQQPTRTDQLVGKSNEKGKTMPISHVDDRPRFPSTASEWSIATALRADSKPKLLPTLNAVTRPGSNEQLYGRRTSVAGDDSEVSTSTLPSPPLASLPGTPVARLRPVTADASTSRPSSYFTISASSTKGSPGDNAKSESNPVASPTVTRRVSLSDLRIPSRITDAQARIGQDLQRVKEFKAGVEELKSLRRAYRTIVSPPKVYNSTVDDTHDHDLHQHLPPKASAKFEQAVRRIEGQYSAYWECVDVLVELADGESENDPEATNSARARRERCISMLPIMTSSSTSVNEVSAKSMPTAPAILNASESRHVEVLRNIFREGSPFEATKSMTGGDAQQNSRRTLRPFSTQDARKIGGPQNRSNKLPKSGNAFGIREFLKTFRRDNASARTSSSLQPVVLHNFDANANSPNDQRQQENSEEEEDWDRRSDSSFQSKQVSQSANGLAISRARVMSAHPSPLFGGPDELANVPLWPRGAKLAFSSENMPTLLAYLGEVKERCASCLQELRAVTV